MEPGQRRESDDGEGEASSTAERPRRRRAHIPPFLGLHRPSQSALTLRSVSSLCRTTGERSSTSSKRSVVSSEGTVSSPATSQAHMRFLSVASQLVVKRGNTKEAVKEFSRLVPVVDMSAVREHAKLIAAVLICRLEVVRNYLRDKDSVARGHFLQSVPIVQSAGP